MAQMPRHRQVAWLNEMTNDICTAQHGSLSHKELECAPELMNAWAHLDSPDCALKVESLVKRVIDERTAGNDQASLTLSEYNYLLEGWARSGAGEAAAERCTQIVQAMQSNTERTVHPNLSSFKAVLLSWKQAGRCREAPEESLRMLEWMVELYENGENPQACPDADCFDVVLQIWSRSGRSDAPPKTEKILYAMEAMYEATQNKRLKPRTTSFNAVLNAWAKSNRPKAWKRVLDILGFMELLSQTSGEETVPDQATYVSSIVSLARAKDADPAIAQKLLQRVENIYFANIGNEKVDKSNHNDVDDDDMTAYIGRKSNIHPDTIMYNSVIGCLSRGPSQGNYRKAKSILDHQVKLHQQTDDDNLKPDVYGYTSVMSTCAMETDQRKKAFGVALSAFQHLRNHPEFGVPNHVTYGTMLKCCAKLLPTSDPLREKWVRKIWNMCVENGCVGDMVLSRMRESATGPLFKELMGGVRKKDLPEEWTRNVKEMRDVRVKRSGWAKKAKKTAEV